MQPPHNSDLTKLSPSSRSLEGFCRIPILSEVERVHFRPHWVKPKVPPLLATAYFTFLSNKRILKCQMSSYTFPIKAKSSPEEDLEGGFSMRAVATSSLYCLFNQLQWGLECKLLHSRYTAFLCSTTVLSISHDTPCN